MNDIAVLLIVFTGASLAIIAGAGADIVPPIFKLAAAAIAAGCAAVLALLRPPGGPPAPRPPTLPTGGQRGN